VNSILINILEADRRRVLENVREAAARIWSRPLHRYYTDHTVDHSERVIALLDGLTAGMMATDKRLSSTEVSVLLVAAYLHDIGMQDERFADGDLEVIRDTHHEVTAELIYRAVEYPAQAVNLGLPGDPGLVEAVALVAKGHRRVDLNAAEYEPLVHSGEVVRLRLLAALLRFGDELDIDHRRVDLEQMKLLALPMESQLHWWKCHYVSGVSIADEYIRIGYRFPQDRPDYKGLIVPLVEGEVRARHAALEEIFRAHAVKVALGRSQVRLMRLVQSLPPEVEAQAQQKLKTAGVSNERMAEMAERLARLEGLIAREKERKRTGLTPSMKGLELTVYDPCRKDLTNQLTLSIPQKDPSRPRKAEPIAFRFYLLNNSEKMARYIQIEMFVKAHFLSYPYETDPLIIKSTNRWEVDRMSDNVFRCFLEGGVDLVCHGGGKWRDLGVMEMLVPCGEAEGGAVTINIPYSITAEEHTGGGLLTVWLQEATTD